MEAKCKKCNSDKVKISINTSRGRYRGKCADCGYLGDYGKFIEGEEKTGETGRSKSEAGPPEKKPTAARSRRAGRKPAAKKSGPAVRSKKPVSKAVWGFTLGLRNFFDV